MLKALSECIGVSGSEGKVRELIRQSIERDIDDLVEDTYGNLIVRKGKKTKPTIMLAAHMDEVGVIVTGIDKAGFLRFKTIGISPNVLLAKRVVIGKSSIPGVIGHKPIHQTKEEDRQKIPEIKDLFIDIGATSKEEAQKSISVGDLGTFDTQFSEQGDRIYGKAFDNRTGCYILIQLIRNADLPITYAFTVQEEAGLRGARIAAYRVSPDIAIAVDTTASGEWPEDKDLPTYPEVGKGPVISIADRSVICDRKLVQMLEAAAKKHDIPYQFKRPMIGGTDAGAMHITKGGIRSAVVQTTARYIHSPLSVASKRDINFAVKLLEVGLQRMLREESLWS